MNHPIEPPFVSVILAVRNGARFIAEALQSVVRQNYPAYELLIIDGHSTDDTASIVRGFPGAQFITQPGGGLSNAWNTGLTLARGNWIALLEHDDVWLPRKLHTQIAFMQERPDLEYTFSRGEFFLEPGCAWPQGYRPEWLKTPQIGSMLSAMVARKSAFDRVGGFDEKMRFAADMDWLSRARDLQVPMAYLEETLIRKRVHDSNVTAQIPQNHAELLQLMRRKIAGKRREAEAKDV